MFALTSSPIREKSFPASAPTNEVLHTHVAVLQTNYFGIAAVTQESQGCLLTLGCALHSACWSHASRFPTKRGLHTVDYALRQNCKSYHSVVPEESDATLVAWVVSLPSGSTMALKRSAGRRISLSPQSSH